VPATRGRRLPGGPDGDRARADPPAEQVEAICREFAQGAADADWETKRQLLENLEIQVAMRGLD